MAAELIEAEGRIRESEVQPDGRAAWGRRQQRLYRHLGINEDWADDVLTQAASRAPTSVALAIELNWTARKELSELTTSGNLSAVLPAWRIREPLPPEELLGYYRSAERETGIEWVYLAAINLVETRMGRIEGLSTAGATGPMQFLPSTWEECCEGDPNLDRDAIRGAAEYLVDRGGPADMDRALQGYNNSGYYVRAVSAYADVLRDDPRAYYGYHAWEVFFRSAAGLVRLPVGYYETDAVDAATWIASNPEHLLE
jgi:membrane-bound lytic murein transglycosylase B